jgi:dTDP-L-rhamnose 4-epimerase
VTGGAGFIGSHIVDTFVEAGCDVIVIDSLNPDAHSKEPSYLNASAQYEWLDVRLVGEHPELLENIDAVCHQASMVGLEAAFSDVAKYVAHNDLGTAALLQALDASSWRGRFILASSVVVYGEGAYRCGEHGRVHVESRKPRDLLEGRFDHVCPTCGRELAPAQLTEETPANPRSVYAATKLHQEHLCAAFGRHTGVSIAALRYHNVYGARMPENSSYCGVAATFRSALESNRSPEVYEDGLQLRDFIHVKDVARANLACLLAPDPVDGEFNVASGEPRSIGELAHALSVARGRSSPRSTVTGRFRVGDVRHVYASPNKAVARLGWRPEIPWDVGIKELACAPMRS